MFFLVAFLLLSLGISVFTATFYIGRIILLRTLPNRRLSSLLKQAQSEPSAPNFIDVKKVSQNANLLKVEMKKNQHDYSRLFQSLIRELSNNYVIKEERARLLFEQAGIILHDPLFVFIVLKITLSVLSVLLTWVAFREHLLDFLVLSQFKSFYIILMGLVGWSLLDIYLTIRTNKRLLLLERGFPDALDVMIICVGAGLTIDKCFERVAQEVGSLNKEIAREFAITSVELGILLDQKHALMNMAKRVPNPIFQSFASVIIQSVQQGTAILKAFEILSAEIRQHRMHLAEVKAAQLPTKLLFPLTILILPTLFILLLGPSAVQMARMF